MPNFMIQVDRFISIIPVSQANLRLQIEYLEVLQHSIALLYHINEQTIFILVLFSIGFSQFGKFFAVRQIGKYVACLEITNQL